MGKIAQNGKYLVAAAGLVRGMNLIQHSFVPPSPPRSNLDKFMVNRFVPALRKCFQAAGYDMKDDGGVAQHENEFLVAVKGVIYLIDEAYGVERTSNKIYVTGTGMELALGAAHALGIGEIDDWEEAVEVLQSAVEIAIEYDIYSGGSVQFALQNTAGTSWVSTG